MLIVSSGKSNGLLKSTTAIAASALLYGGSAIAANPDQAKIVGTWEGQTRNGQKVVWIFQPNGDLYPFNANSSPQIRWRYEFNSSTGQKQINLATPMGMMGCIYSFTGARQVRINCNDLNYPGHPTSFDARTTVLTKKTNQTALSPYTRNSGATGTYSQNSQLEQAARTCVGFLVSSQQIALGEYGQFFRDKKSSPLLLSSDACDRSETAYQLHIVIQGKPARNAIVVAKALKPGLKSFTGLVYTNRPISPGTRLGIAAIKGISATIVCESNTASTAIPAMPTATAGNPPRLTCATGSSATANR
jgi:hypothetical protein